ncbi:tRNA glutamyl-Q synthetase [Litoribacter alkaliphilus]|uniref:tRNA glutamyl-Q synthetase n=1 Tax=Litoribacter ruber TaxID=702568 RepID=A0AAP2CGA8_9BACT|nr:glutamate--tRNA ligase family protein [Litoribacter alkaliphilus]MBS9523270.1 tRNA glutamyl-Q synthetase [Litoribacter alkaliphilus]
MKFTKTRLAPTPSGYLHLGNVLNFLITAALARQQGATILLRIDDLDQARKRAAYVQDIFETLEYLKIPFDEGPKDMKDFENNWSQVHRLPLYQNALEGLKAQKAIFSCSCSRKQILSRSKKGIYKGKCIPKNLLFEKKDCCWRCRVKGKTVTSYQTLEGHKKEIQLPKKLQHFIVRRKHLLPAYQIASLVDDLHYGIDMIVRGEDLLGSTAAQLILSEILDEANFANICFYHHPLIKDESSIKLSKSAGSTSIHYMRSIGIPPSDIYKMVSDFLKMEPVNKFEEFVEGFRMG